MALHAVSSRSRKGDRHGAIGPATGQCVEPGDRNRLPPVSTSAGDEARRPSDEEGAEQPGRELAEARLIVVLHLVVPCGACRERAGRVPEPCSGLQGPVRLAPRHRRGLPVEARLEQDPGRLLQPLGDDRQLGAEVGEVPVHHPAGVEDALQARRRKRQARDPDDRALVLGETSKLSRLLWLNAGLDILYMMGGLALAQTRGRKSGYWRGHGLGIIVQGGFLFIFDLWHAVALRAQSDEREL